MVGFPSTPFKALDKVWEIFGRSQGLKDVLSVCFFWHRIVYGDVQDGSGVSQDLCGPKFSLWDIV